MKKTASQTKEQAIDAFVAKKIHIDEMLARLQALSEEHFNAEPEAIHWGHVGTLEHIEAQLKEIVDFAFHEGEYAK